MKYSYGKLFRTNFNNGTSIDIIDYDYTKDYYQFLQEEKRNGRTQIIIHSCLMIDIMKKLVLEDTLLLEKVDFLEEDEGYYRNLNNLIKKTRKDKELFEIVTEKLNVLYSDESIEISNVLFSNKESQLEIKSNGIIRVDSESYMEIKSKIKKILEDFMNGK